jgi:hypothetical protein
MLADFVNLESIPPELTLLVEQKWRVELYSSVIKHGCFEVTWGQIPNLIEYTTLRDLVLLISVANRSIRGIWACCI